ncbi:hypothetical protein GCM10010365_06090 [Streptomyces poonensis]|uniref:DUF4245 domain-containing protein n=2 Tax=Streptomyces poonensis TaxID=68255 RepID=A0A918UCU6_9ACTN|nr:hypothetical protein GCM10010365_06090 [Streptomyces poonensis]GLJ87954.1 hypothetical protein GCM10017589_05540 [Streptomyces poonensis]
MKGKQTVRDMILSLGLICVAAGVIYLFVPHDDKEPELKRLDYRVELLTARRAASYPVAAPEGLPDSWKATSVRFQGDQSDAWHLGYHAPDGQYVGVEQSAAEKTSEFIEDATQGAEKTEDTEEIGGRTWQRYEGERYDALVLPGEGSTTVVTGSASFAQLRTMAEALETE